MPSSSEIEILIKRFADSLTVATKTAIKETMDKIGNDSIDGMVKYSGKVNKHIVPRLNKTSKLRVRSGNLLRSLNNPTDRNAIREVTANNGIVTGTIGSKAESEKGFGYPKFHEFGEGRNGPRYGYFLTNAIRKNENFLKEKLLENINKIRFI